MNNSDNARPYFSIISLRSSQLLPSTSTGQCKIVPPSEFGYTTLALPCLQNHMDIQSQAHQLLLETLLTWVQPCSAFDVRLATSRPRYRWSFFINLNCLFCFGFTSLHATTFHSCDWRISRIPKFHHLVRTK
jgi:hypothetical protein